MKSGGILEIRTIYMQGYYFAYSEPAGEYCEILLTWHCKGAKKVLQKYKLVPQDGYNVKYLFISSSMKIGCIDTTYSRTSTINCQEWKKKWKFGQVGIGKFQPTSFGIYPTMG